MTKVNNCLLCICTLWLSLDLHSLVLHVKVVALKAEPSNDSINNAYHYVTTCCQAGDGSNLRNSAMVKARPIHKQAGSAAGMHISRGRQLCL